MDLYLLINISSDTENLYGVAFFNSFFKKCSGLNVTLFHICQLGTGDSSNSLLESWDNPTESMDEKLSGSARMALERSRRTLQRNEAQIDALNTKTVQERYGTVKDILAEGSQGLYDAMILGRRATYTLQWLFDRPGNQIPQALIQDTTLACPIWICGEPEAGRRDVLLCVDGSRSALRAADHVGYILSRAKQHNVCIFHVTTTRTSDIENTLHDAKDVLLTHGIAPERIRSKRGWGLSIPGAILTEKNQGQYAAIALGLHGISRGRLFANIGLQEGIISTLLKKVSKAALWCIP